MKTVQFLCKQMGENSTTSHDLYSEIVNGKVKISVPRKDENGRKTLSYDKIEKDLSEINMNETISVCLAFDNDMLVQKELWSIREVQLPDWLSGEEYLRMEIRFKYLWGFGCSMETPEKIQRFLLDISDEALRLGYIKLLSTKNFKSPVRESLYNQVMAWIDTNPEDRKYGKPLSWKQEAMLVNRHVMLEAKQKSTSLYWRR